MLYAKISTNGEILRWPVQPTNVKWDLYAKGKKITSANLLAEGYVRVPYIKEEIPEATINKKIVLDGIEERTDGWHRTYKLVDVPADEQQQHIDNKWKLIRRERDALFKKHSWRIERYNRQVRLGETPADDIAVLDNYFTTLANIPQNYSNPFEVVFPQEP